MDDLLPPFDKDYYAHKQNLIAEVNSSEPDSCSKNSNEIGNYCEPRKESLNFEVSSEANPLLPCLQTETMSSLSMDDIEMVVGFEDPVYNEEAGTFLSPELNLGEEFREDIEKLCAQSDQIAKLKEPEIPENERDGEENAGAGLADHQSTECLDETEESEDQTQASVSNLECAETSATHEEHDEDTETGLADLQNTECPDEAESAVDETQDSVLNLESSEPLETHEEHEADDENILEIHEKETEDMEEQAHCQSTELHEKVSCEDGTPDSSSNMEHAETSEHGFDDDIAENVEEEREVTEEDELATENGEEDGHDDTSNVEFAETSPTPEEHEEGSETIAEMHGDSPENEDTEGNGEIQDESEHEHQASPTTISEANENADKDISEKNDLAENDVPQKDGDIIDSAKITHETEQEDTVKDCEKNLPEDGSSVTKSGTETGESSESKAEDNVEKPVGTIRVRSFGLKIASVDTAAPLPLPMKMDVDEDFEVETEPESSNHPPLSFEDPSYQPYLPGIVPNSSVPQPLVPGMSVVEDKVPYVCHQCNKTCIGRDAFKKHRSSTHQKNFILGPNDIGPTTHFFRCSFCSKGFAGKSLTERHRKEVHNIHVNNNSRKCGVCMSVFSTPTERFKHEVFLHGLKMCPNTGRAISQLPGFSNRLPVAASRLLVPDRTSTPAYPVYTVRPPGPRMAAPPRPGGPPMHTYTRTRPVQPRPMNPPQRSSISVRPAHVLQGTPVPQGQNVLANGYSLLPAATNMGAPGAQLYYMIPGQNSFVAAAPPPRPVNTVQLKTGIDWVQKALFRCVTCSSEFSTALNLKLHATAMDHELPKGLGDTDDGVDAQSVLDAMLSQPSPSPSLKKPSGESWVKGRTEIRKRKMGPSPDSDVVVLSDEDEDSGSSPAPAPAPSPVPAPSRPPPPPRPLKVAKVDARSPPKVISIKNGSKAACPVCPKTPKNFFDSPSLLLQHMRTVHKAKVRGPIPPAVKRPPPPKTNGTNEIEVIDIS